MSAAPQPRNAEQVRLPGPPPLVLALAAALLLVLPVVAALWLLRAELDLWRALGLATGVLALALLLLQFLSSGRFESLSGKTGIDRTMRAHQLAGRALLMLVIAHPLLLVFPAPGDDWAAVPETLWVLTGMRPMRSGTLALLLLVLLVGWSLLRRRLRRKLPHELWRVAHLLLAIAAAAAAVHHALSIGSVSPGALRPYWWLLLVAAAAAVLWVHGIKRMQMARRPWRVTGNRDVAAGIRELTLQADGHRPAPFLPGQFAWLDIGRQPVPVRDHPFSIASSPAELPVLRLLIKARGDFTGALDRVALGSRAFLDYPHGAFTPQVRPWDRLLLVAGGIGVAPIFSILRALADAGDRRPVTLIYGANFAADFVGRDELAQLAQRLVLDVQLFVDHPTDDAPLRPRADLLPQVAAVAREARGGRLLAMICGPVGMPRAVEAVLRAEGVEREAIVYERFDYD
jgi:predicted ferric reductase